MIDFKCPKCGGKMEVPDSLAGGSETCPACYNVIIVPSPHYRQQGFAVSIAAGSPNPSAPVVAPPIEWTGEKTFLRRKKAVLIASISGGAFLILIVGIILLVFYSRGTPVPSIPEQQRIFQKVVFTNPLPDTPQSSIKTITLISESECEIETYLGGRDVGITAARYSREGDRLRIVFSNSSSVLYLQISSEGLADRTSGAIYLLPESLKSRIKNRSK